MRSPFDRPSLAHQTPGCPASAAARRATPRALAWPFRAGSSAAPPGQPRSPREPLSRAETRVLRYLPTNLTVPEIAGQLYLSANTVRTHMRHLYDKLGAHRRHEAVDRARTLGLLAPSARRP